jgi:hypothetical protein
MDTRRRDGYLCTGERVPAPTAGSGACETDDRNRPDEGDPNVAAEEPVTSPDQHKPGPNRAARIGAVIVIVALLAMVFPLHKGHVEDIFLVATAAAIAAALIADWLLRKNGLK